MTSKKKKKKKKKNQRREQGLRCALMPGECFNSEAAANEMRLTRQLNVARGGMEQVVYHVRKCLCGRHHLITDEHLREWEAKQEKGTS